VHDLPSTAVRPTEVGDDALYDPAFVRALFDEMAATYERVNLLTSFGFSRRWRRQAVAALEPSRGDVVLDAMTGMGEGWRHLLPAIGPTGRIVAIDLSPRMIDGALAERRRLGADRVDVVVGDALATGLTSGEIDAAIALFGLKTLSPAQQTMFATELRRVLKPGGHFVLIEVSVPPARLLRVPYMAYLRHVIPVLGRVLLGNPENYRMLGRYTERFGDCRRIIPILEDAGLEARFIRHFFGCATSVVGRRPDLDSADEPRPARLGP
jgi:ubiquinone/menaquinone biosynthesis methyltransferase